MSSAPYVCNALRGAALAVLGGLLPLHDLEVGFVGLHRQRSCGNVIPLSVYKGMYSDLHSYYYICIEEILVCFRDIVARIFFICT